MNMRTNRSIYNRPSVHHSGSSDKDQYMRAFMFTNELSRLEYEKKAAKLKVITLEKRIEEIREEIYNINSRFVEKNDYEEQEIIIPEQKKKHVTMEY